MLPKPWPKVPVNLSNFRNPPREYGILPFWFLNGELDLDEMRYQLKEFREKGMPGIILHGRFGLEIPYIGETYLERIRFAVAEAEKLGLQTWIYDEMNWPSGTADKQVLKARPDLVQRYLECINFSVRGPWFTYLTGEDSRYNDFERSTPVAAFAVGSDGRVVDLTPNLSFRDVIPWEAPEGNWRLIYIVEKTADYYIDAINPESTAEFLKLGYEPYVKAVGDKLTGQVPGFYTDEPAMHYYVTGGDNPVVPWTKDMFSRFQERNGYNLRPRLPDLFFDISPDSPRVRYDFYNSLSEFYSQAFYRQIHEWCQEHKVLFTGHLLYEEWLRQMIRVEGNLFKHYPHFDVVGVDHLYPIIGDRDRPAEHVAMKAGSSGAHQVGSPRLLCESFGGIFMDATMQRMKWIADWEYVLGVNLLNPHGFHYTLEGPRKRDWPPSMFYQYPWWEYYGEFSAYISRLSHLLSGGEHVAKVAVIWPINAMFATYTPQSHNKLGDRIEHDFNTLTDLLLRLHYDFDYVDEDLLATAEIQDGGLRIKDETYELLIVPPMAHIKMSTLACMERFFDQGGKLLGAIFLPAMAFDQSEKQSRLVDISSRIQALFGVDPCETQASYQSELDIELVTNDGGSGGKTVFVRSYALERSLPLRAQEIEGVLGDPGRKHFVTAGDPLAPRYFYEPSDGDRIEITQEVQNERDMVAVRLGEALEKLIEPDITIDNREIFYLHRKNDGQDLYFLVNPTRIPQTARVTLPGEVQPVAWDPSTGSESLLAPWQYVGRRSEFSLVLPAAGSIFINPREIPREFPGMRIAICNTSVFSIDGTKIKTYGRVQQGILEVATGDKSIHRTIAGQPVLAPLVLGGEWEFEPLTANALVIRKWLAISERPGAGPEEFTGESVSGEGWLPMVPGAWSYQLPAEPVMPYPVPVWYRIPFEVEDLPEQLSLIVDGFAGAEWQLYLNGEKVTSTPSRSVLDAQMKSVDLTPWLRRGKNLIALRLVVTEATGGLLDLLKLTGKFRVVRSGETGERIAAPARFALPEPWTKQGYPYFSGRAAYRKRFTLPESFLGQRLFLHPDVGDDVVEVIVNGQPAGVRLWAPYQVDITDLVKPGENLLELRVANTLVNLLEAVERPSGLCAAPQIIPYGQFEFDLTQVE